MMEHGNPEFTSRKDIECKHGKISPGNLHKAYRISKDAYELLFTHFKCSENNALTSPEDYCEICVQEVCKHHLSNYVHSRDLAMLKNIGPVHNEIGRASCRERV